MEVPAMPDVLITFIGGPLHGTFTQRPDPPDLIPHHVGDHTVLYVRRWNLALTEHTAVFAPVAMFGAR